jgi:hypothetical protein
MCPICKAEAEEIEPGTFDGVWFRCLKHREFGVSDTALKTRKDAEAEQWERAGLDLFKDRSKIEAVGNVAA